MQVLSIQEFKDKYEIEKFTFGEFKSGKYGWNAQKKSGESFNGPMSSILVRKLQKKEISKDSAVFVEYKWDNWGNERNKSVWVLQLKPTDWQKETSDASYRFLFALNMQKKRLYGDKMKPISLQQIKYHLMHTQQDNCYVSFNIPKKNGGVRTISAPNHGLKIIQSCINLLLQEKYSPTAAAMGFVPGRSVADNAMMHIGQNYVFNIDLKDFFPTITSSRVFAKLQTPPYSFDKTTASIITDLCCFKGILPQGAPTSPIITNIICERLDWRLTKLAHNYGLKYTRYADDITFSGMSNLFHKNGSFIKSLYHFIEKEGFIVNPQKTRLNTKNFRQEVTGLTVNEKPNVSKQYVKTLRAMIHRWEVLGHDSAQKIMAERYRPNGISPFKGIPQIENVILGKLNYMKMIKGGSDPTYQKLNGRYQSLVQKDFGISSVIEKWKSDGIDAACKLLLGKQSWDGLLNKWRGSLNEFETLIGSSVVFSPSVKQNNASEEDRKDESQGKCASGLLLKIIERPKRPFYIPTINNQQYWGNVKLVCDRGLCLDNEIFVSYGILNEKSVFFFSNADRYLLHNGKVIGESSLIEMLHSFAEGRLNKQIQHQALKKILSHNITSPEIRELRAELILEEFNAILNSLEDKPSLMASLKEKKKEILLTIDNLRKGTANFDCHAPKEVVSFLKSFTTEGNMLKYTTHTWDGAMEESIFRNKDLDAFVEKYKETLEKPLWDLRTKYNEPLGDLIYKFLLNDKDGKNGEKVSWGGDYNIKIGYCYPKGYMKEWMSTHPNAQPMEMPLSEFPQEYQPASIEDRSLIYFEDIVNIFKEAIEFRGDNLYLMCESLCKNIGLRMNREKLKTLKGVGFYTDTNAIERVIRIILQQCKQYPRFPDVEISATYSDDNSYVILEILHINSYSNKSLRDDKINLIGGQMRDIKKILRGLCDWSIESYFKDENGETSAWRIDYLYSENYNDTPRPQRIPECKGFKHIMKFYL